MQDQITLPHFLKLNNEQLYHYIKKNNLKHLLVETIIQHNVEKQMIHGRGGINVFGRRQDQGEEESINTLNPRSQAQLEDTNSDSDFITSPNNETNNKEEEEEEELEIYCLNQK